MKNIKLIAYNDPEHGWLRVSSDLIVDLKLEDKIGPYSYVKPNWVYLEEDQDAGLFLDAATAAGYNVTIVHKYTDARSPIRSFSSYSVDLLFDITGQTIVIAEGEFTVKRRENSYYIIENRYGQKYRLPVKNAGDYILGFVD